MTAPQQCESDKPIPVMASPRAITSLSTWTFWKKPRLPPRGFFLFRSGRPVALRRKRHVLGAEHARAAMLEAEQRSAVARERIAIGDGAEEIDGRGAELDLAHLFLGEWLRQARFDGEAVAAGIDGALAALWRAPVEAVGHRIEHSAIGPVAHAVRRRLPEIADGAFDHRLLSGGDAGDEGLARAEIGAELHLGEVMRAGDEIARGEPQEDGGEQKEKREGSDDVVAVRGVELRQALPRALRHEHGGAVGLRRGSCGRGGLRRGALFEAGLERGRGADEQNPDQEQDTEKDPGAQSEHPRRSDNSRRRLSYPEPRPRERLTAGGCGGNLKQSANRAACWRVESSRGNR